MAVILPGIVALMTKSADLQKIIRNLLCRNWPYSACVIQFSFFAGAVISLCPSAHTLLSVACASVGIFSVLFLLFILEFSFYEQDF